MSPFSGYTHLPFTALPLPFFFSPETTEKFHLSESATCIDKVLKCIRNLLDRDFLSCFSVLRGAYDTVCALPDGFYWFIEVIDLEIRSPDKIASFSRNIAFLTNRNICGRHLR